MGTPKKSGIRASNRPANGRQRSIPSVALTPSIELPADRVAARDDRGALCHETRAAQRARDEPPCADCATFRSREFEKCAVGRHSIGARRIARRSRDV